MRGLDSFAPRSYLIARSMREFRSPLVVALVGLALVSWCCAVGWAEQSPTSLASQEEAAMRAAIKAVEDSVVQIRTIGGLDSVEETLLPDGPTTGLVISADGYLVSSAFNFVQQPASILVTFNSGKQAPAELVATDHSRMLVLLKVVGVADLQVPELAPAGESSPGEWAIAVGRTYQVERTNVSVGIVSAVGRMFGKVLQTDADVSTANYGGPLIDLRGRVLGVIVPMAPQATSDVAGVEWYDSGIGFAVPLAPIMDRLELMKRGEDQRAGIMGIAMAAKSPHSSPAELAVVRPDSPAGKAGFKRGDRIVEIEGKPIRTQTDFRFALGARYHGETIKIVALRGDTRIEKEIELVGELAPFRHAFMGVLPMRPDKVTANDQSEDAEKKQADAPDGEKSAEEDAEKERPGSGPPQDVDANGEPSTTEEAVGTNQPQGIRVRMVYPESPAAEAGIQTGDHIVRIGETDISNFGDAIREMNSMAPERPLAVRVMRADKPIDVTLTTARLPNNVPNVLPPAIESSPSDLAPPATAAGESRELKLPEFPQQCHVYVPATVAAGCSPGVLMWIRAADDPKAEELIRAWQPICDRDGLLLVVPESSDAARWERTELPYLRRLLARAIGQFKADRARVTIAGRAGGGEMAWFLGLASRDVVRGLAVIAAPLPRQIKPPANEPSQRLAIFCGLPAEKPDEKSPQIIQGIQKLSEAGYPVTTATIINPAGQLTDEQREELARWIDSLDRF